jgi:hypothetical protein
MRKPKTFSHLRIELFAVILVSLRVAESKKDVKIHF